MRSFVLPAVLLALLAPPFASVCAEAPPAAAPAATAATGHGVVDVEPQHLQSAFWIARIGDADRVLMDARAIAAHNAALLRDDPAVHDLAGLPAVLARAEVAERISALSSLPQRTLYDASGTPVGASVLRALLDNAAIAAIPEKIPLRFGMVTARADMRTFPGTLRVFSSADDSDIDRFQETALFPGTPLALLHESRDGHWWFAVGPLYAAWIEKRHVAVGERDTILAYQTRSPFVVVTGARVRTVYNPELPAVSEFPLEMGARVPLRADWPADKPVHGQHPYTSWVLDLPVRRADGSLDFAPALLQRNAEVSPGYLPMTSANLVAQGFRFLGERYGWGHSYNARDCSGFVAEVYRSLGVLLPRNSRDQAHSPVLQDVAYDAAQEREQRIALLRTLEVGDLVYIPGHVMMVIGQTPAGPYVIHDTTGIGYLDAEGRLQRVPLNQVAVTPLLPLQADSERATIDTIYSIQRVRAGATP